MRIYLTSYVLLMQSILVQSLEANVVCYDYSGYGESGGVAQENNTYSDIKAVYNYCVDHVATNPKNIILYGQSVRIGNRLSFSV
jgi:hypothetical protein